MNLDEHFKYRVGDVVKLRAIGKTFISRGTCKHQDESYSWARDNIIVYTVIERELQECHGGVQVKYTCRASSSNNGILISMPGRFDGLVQLDEFEIEPYDDTQLKLELERKNKGAT